VRRPEHEWEVLFDLVSAYSIGSLTNSSTRLACWDMLLHHCLGSKGCPAVSCVDAEVLYVHSGIFFGWRLS
jgi:hypothetical protein